MSALAQYLRWTGLEITGSDRLLNSEDTAAIRNNLTAIGSTLFDQNGSGISSSTDIVCISTAIEEANPDIAKARTLNIPVLHRSDVLAAIVQSKKAIAVAGTSGKSTVTAMIFELLTACGKSPSLISGAGLRRLENEGLIGNAFYGTSEYIVIEADESDGTLVKYHPYLSVILNVSKDHKTIPEIIGLFETLSGNSMVTITNVEDEHLRPFKSTRTFGLQKADWCPDEYHLGTLSGKIVRNGYTYCLPLPGYHNLSNLCAALSVCDFLECDQRKLTEAVSSYQGVARRFTVHTTRKDIFVVDDFAHNPEKIKAAVTAARNLSKRLFVIYQPHGFGPTRFLKDEYISVFKKVFTPDDTLFLLPIYYAGGTAQKDISSQMIIDSMGQVSFQALAPESRDQLLTLLGKAVSPKDCVLLMGARDPSLASFGLKIADLFGGKAS